MNNYADYAATQLQYYGLTPNSAENDGQGTVWTHYAISRFLGGTDHSDPHAYLQSHNYTYNELYDLINEKYLIKTGQVAPGVLLQAVVVHRIPIKVVLVIVVPLLHHLN